MLIVWFGLVRSGAGVCVIMQASALLHMVVRDGAG